MIAIVGQRVPAGGTLAMAIPFLSLTRVSQPTPVSRGVIIGEYLLPRNSPYCIEFDNAAMAGGPRSRSVR
ncbi:hypothetical protein [Rugamonas sp.]|uniref:hypothetical protein n=1 Tax=Rugamonas sp. TaxID=1926287 RepID=UPI0025D710D3|nr:hypothetical protein [Rugamonas sp.]